MFCVLSRAYFLINLDVGARGGKLWGRCGRVYGVRCGERSKVWGKWEKGVGKCVGL